MRGAPILLVLVSAITLLAACGAEKVSSTANGPDQGAQALEVDEPSWVFQPLEKAPSSDQVEFEGGVVEVDGAGSRWWTRPDQAPEVSAFGAPEPLSAVMKSGGRLASVGESGAVYFSDHALSQFAEVRTPPERFVMTRRSGSNLMAIAEDGSIRRSDNAGRSWAVSRADRYFVDLGAASDGTVLALSVPEQWYKSSDAGRTFSLIELESQAPRSVRSLLTGELLVSGLYQASVFRAGKFEPASQELLRSASRRDSVEYSLPQFALASAVASGRAALDDGIYWALMPGTSGKPWHLSRGTLGGPLSRKAVRGIEECGAFRFAAAHGRTVVICEIDSGEVSPRLKLFRSLASSNEYRPIQAVLRGQLAQLKVAVSKSGKIAITELCPRAEKGCDPLGVTVVSAEGEARQTFLPGVSRPSAIAFDSSDRLWLSGHRVKDGHFVAYLDQGDRAPGKLTDLSRDAAFPTITGEEARLPLQMLPGDAGDVSVTLLVSGRAYVGHLARGAEVAAFGSTPPGATAIHGAGHRVAALQADEEVLWESLTGGLSWSKNTLPRGLCSGPRGQCQSALVCSQVGCLVGDELARVGWGKANDGKPPSLPAESGADLGQAELSGFECQVDEGSWRDLEGLLEVPRVSNAALGSAAWSASLKLPETAALTAISVRFGMIEIEREVLLPPVSGGQNYAFYVSPQVEGVAAVRYQIPQASAGSTWPVAGAIRAEVAWDSRVTNVYGSAQIDTVHLPSGGLFGGFGAFHPGQPELMSVAGRGIYFRMGPAASDNPTLFIQGRGKLAQIERLEEVVYPSGPLARGGWVNEPEMQASQSAEFVQVSGQHAGLLSFANRRVMTLALGLDGKGSASTFRPYLLGMPRQDATGIAQGVHYAYLGEDLGFVSLQVNLDGPGHRAAFVGFDEKSGFTTPVFVPLQHDLKETIVPCSAEQRRLTPRVLAPPVLGAFRPVEVHGAELQALELRSSNAVLHGTPDSPCVAAFDTEDDRRQDPQSDRYSALVFPGGKSWIFRTYRRPGGLHTTSVRPMSCRHDGALPKSAH